jgi:hypothetical protein
MVDRIGERGFPVWHPEATTTIDPAPWSEPTQESGF